MPIARRRSSRSTAVISATAVALALSAGCATTPYSPRDVHPGDTRDAVLAKMGPPTATYTLPDGRLRLEYNHMPFGKHTYMIDLDPAGRVATWENVLDENHFAAIRPGMDAQDVLRLIGPPSYTSHYFRPAPGNTWLYRFETIQRCILFEVSFDAATGRVIDGDYPPDPACPDEWM